MKKLILLTVFAIVMLAGPAYGQMPEVKIENGKGEAIDFQTLSERKVPLLVSFWSTTCKPCIAELNAVNDALEEWRKQVEFDVVAVSFDDVRSSSKARALASGNDWDAFTLLYDKNQELMRALNITVVPYTLIFDRKGKIVYSHVGYTPGTELEYLEILKSLKN